MGFSVSMGGKESYRSEPNVVPLCDVLLVLLIIFMIVTPLIQKGVDVKLPNAQFTANMPENPDVVLAIKKDARDPKGFLLYVNQDKVTMETLQNALEEAFLTVSEKKLYLEQAWFFARTRRFTDTWQIILLVDQSGSMTSSVIHSAVTAACLWGLPGMRTHLVAFDTAVVDLTENVTDPVELLMKVQLGGGTDIQKAVAYAAELIEAPRRAIVVLVSDFYEGGHPGMLVRRIKALCEQGVHVLGLAALDEQANPVYDREAASQLVAVGAHVAALTPGQLAAWIAEKVRS